MKRGYDPKILEKAYKVGNIVYVLDTATGHVVNNSSLERTRGNSKIKKNPFCLRDYIARKNCDY